MAKVKILVEGYLSAGSEGRTGSTISLVLDNNIVMVVDPGFLKDQQILVDALEKEGLSVDDVNFVCITHSHIDHYANIGMFTKAKVLEYFGIWDKEGRVEDWREKLTDDIQILKTPGHDYSCITMFVRTDDGVVAICGDVFWRENYPEVDPYASDLKKLENSRKLVISMSHWIIPGHSGIYKTQNGYRLQDIRRGKKVEEKVHGACKKCRRPFLRFKDKCPCQEWLCYRCCECEIDCAVCSCKHMTF
ncbi:MAG: MBL fold metallo-hydrolase [Patescibacteria group bacterium]